MAHDKGRELIKSNKKEGKKQRAIKERSKGVPKAQAVGAEKNISPV